MAQIGDNLTTITQGITLMEMGESGPEPRDAAGLFEGKTVALFAVPGAYTPTCSARHLPGFEENAAAFKAKGVDEIMCVSVNDAFVMGAWGEGQDIKHIRLIADGNAQFAEAIALTMDGSGFGMGKRSQRYSMLVKDGIIAQLNVEEGGDFGVSSADYLLNQL